GSNGSGKSTLLRALSGVYEADKGKVLIDNAEAFENPLAKEKCYYIADYPFFFNDSTVNNLAKFLSKIYPNWSYKRFKELCGYFPINRNQRIINMSKGMQRQASLILAFSARPKYLFLDEIFDGLDPVIRQRLKKLIIEDVSENNMTCIIASHNLRELDDICDSIVLMHKGSLVTNTNVDELKSKIHKVQLAFDTLPKGNIFENLNIQKLSQRGNYFSLLIKGEEAEIEEKLKGLNPIFFESVPLTLEEVFISEMEGAGYDI
ncbi:MAG: ATP-binding cassette domain-containing protein, partial [Acutalibacteraceae bacterium]